MKLATICKDGVRVDIPLDRLVIESVLSKQDGRGNWGHGGRPGEQGGSAPKGEGAGGQGIEGVIPYVHTDQFYVNADDRGTWANKVKGINKEHEKAFEAIRRITGKDLSYKIKGEDLHLHDATSGKSKSLGRVYSVQHPTRLREAVAWHLYQK